jgi:hypothetical protein
MSLKRSNSRIACRHFLDQHFDPDILRRLVEGAANAARPNFGF